MRSYGFSTGALFKHDLTRAVDWSRSSHLRVIELSALRLRELDGLVGFVNNNDLSAFTYVSIHAPTDLRPEHEEAVARTLLELALRLQWPVVVHPDCIWNVDFWKPFGKWLCIENMDKRKAIGRTVEELEPFFVDFPDASMCFDIAHAHQVDTTMTEAFRILRSFSTRVCQLHVSEVTSSSKHDRISDAILESFREVADQLPREVPVILETPVSVDDAARELRQAAKMFEPTTQAIHA